MRKALLDVLEGSVAGVRCEAAILLKARMDP